MEQKQKSLPQYSAEDWGFPGCRLSYLNVRIANTESDIVINACPIYHIISPVCMRSLDSGHVISVPVDSGHGPHVCVMLAALSIPGADQEWQLSLFTY